MRVRSRGAIGRYAGSTGSIGCASAVRVTTLCWTLFDNAITHVRNGCPTGSPTTTTTTSSTTSSTTTSSSTTSTSTTQPSSGGAVLFATGSGASSLSPADAAVRSRLQGAGYTVTVVRDRDAVSSYSSAFDLVVISSSVSSNRIGTGFNGNSVPILTWEPYLYDDFGMTGPTSQTHYGLTTARAVSVVAPGHPLAAGFTGSVTVVPAESDVYYGIPAGGTVAVANYPDGRGGLFELRAGAPRSDSGTAAGCRVGFPAGDDTAASHTTDAWTLFDNAVDHVRNGCV